jgi:hypothetical protein
MNLSIGQRVRVKRDLDFYPHFQLKAGDEGVIVEVVSGDTLVWVCIDRHVEGCEEWDNEVAFREELRWDADGYAANDVLEEV